MSRFVFEIFSEELPATLQKKIVSDYKIFTENEFKKKGIVCKNGFSIGITLNRLVLIADECSINDIQLKEFIFKILKEFSKTFPRTMNYLQSEVRWIRPIRNIFACIDDDIIIDNFYGITSKKGSFVDKFHFIECLNCNEYLNFLKENQIEIDYDTRLFFIKQKIYDFDKKVSLSINNKCDDFQNYWINIGNQRYLKLAEEIAGMSEYCIEPMDCVLDQEFNILPFELIELVLRENQRYVVFRKNSEDKIQFLIFGDKITKDDKYRKNIINGHKKVVRARLEDALYYWNLDLNIKKQFIDNNFFDEEKYKNFLKKNLSSRIFIDDILYSDFLQKQEDLAKKNISDNIILKKVIQLIWDTKLDLATNVVAEFPELQGIIEMYYFGYNFNPYFLEKTSLNLSNEILYYYLIDRIVYITIMYQKGKQPTSGGDKYKIKARMDDIVYIFDKKKDVCNISNFFEKNSDIESLFIKRYIKYIEDTFKNKKNINQIAEKYVNCIIYNNSINIDINNIISSIEDNFFIKTYKRIYGYTKNIEYTENKEILTKKNEILLNELNLENINNYLDTHKIADDTVTIQALKIIEVKYFNTKLPPDFLDLV